jgi:myo-inositol-1(or 4)-monophosphatase
MQPMINISLRAIRSSNEQLMQILERDGGKVATAQDLKRFLSQIEMNYYENISRALARAYPAHKIAKRGDFLSADKGFSWHISNIHNPLSFLRGLPDWGISIACKKGGVTEHAILTCPATQDEFTASRGSGASLNGKRIRVSGVATLENAIVATSVLQAPLTEENSNSLMLFKELAAVSFQIRTSHCAPLDLANVAAGRLDAAILDQTTAPDLSAALLLCKEAGGLSGDFNGQPATDSTKRVVCANPKLFKVTTQKLHSLRDLTA